ncbi:hypothetical protein RJ641_021883 [Dillenia turbinata]|uniref:Voltage-gated hydrogen channel 1 n=1 Tax=Dillenia turbinata TaxID=194707 RepID=A0AAN8URW9_9MAGN
MGSSQEVPQQPPTNSFSIEVAEISIQNLIKSWQRRQKWHHLFNSKGPINTNKAPWRTHLANIIESKFVRIASIVLLLLDLVFTVLELSSSIISCSCPKKDGKKDIKEIWYHWVGIAILGILSAKTLAQAVALGGAFFGSPAYVIDGAVLVGALILEAYLEKIGGGLIVVASLWRVVRLVESAFELSDEAIEAQIEGVVCQFELLREENARLMETIVEKDHIIEDLQKELAPYTCICN